MSATPTGNWAKGHQGFLAVRRGSNQVDLEPPALPKGMPRRIRSMLEEGVDPIEYTRSKIQQMVDDGDLPLSAAEVSPARVVRWYVEKNSCSLADEERFANSIGVFVELQADEIAQGDWVDLEPVVRAWGAPEDPATAETLAIAQRQLVRIDSIERDSRTSVALTTAAGVWVVPANMPLGVVLGDGRCVVCGDRLLGSGQCSNFHPPSPEA